MVDRYDIVYWDKHGRQFPELESDNRNGDWVKWEDVKSLIESHELSLKRAFRDGRDAAMADPDHG